MTDKFSNQANKNGRVVVLKHMFTLDELEEDPSLFLDLKENVREECVTLGDVTNVVLYDVSELPVFHLSSCIPWLVAHRFIFFVRSCSKSQRVS